MKKNRTRRNESGAKLPTKNLNRKLNKRDGMVVGFHEFEQDFRYIFCCIKTEIFYTAVLNNTTVISNRHKNKINMTLEKRNNLKYIE